MAASKFHESVESLTPETREMHRALLSLIEELEAVDWYGQRIDATSDDELKHVLIHNREEEKEHACMTLEWIRRRDAKFDEYLRKFLYRSGSIVDAAHTANSVHSTSLEIGSLQGKEV